MELSANFPASGLVVPFLVATQKVYCGTYVANHVVGYNALKSSEENEVLLLSEKLFLHTKYLGEIIQGFWMLLIEHCTL